MAINTRTIYLHAFFIGSITGLLAILFHWSIHHLQNFLFNNLAAFQLQEAQSIFTKFPGIATVLTVLAITTLGGLLVGICIQYWAPEAEGSGLEQLLESFHKKNGELRKRATVSKFFASIITLSSGGSAGKEGPMALIGAGIGSLFGKVLKAGARAKRTLFLAGAAGGLGAIFRAPLGGAITSVEVLYREDFESDALIPCIISSVTAYTLFSSVLGFGHSLNFNSQISHSPLELIFFAILGFLCSCSGIFFIKSHHWIRNFFKQLKVSKMFKPTLAGLVLGCLGLMMPQALGEGLSTIQSLLDGSFDTQQTSTIFFFLLLALLKMLLTHLTIGSGASGGILIPSFFIGALLGAAFGSFAQINFPELVPSITPYIIVGMAAFLASVTNATLGALIMVTELTGSYDLLPPLMVVATISLILSRKTSMYQNQVKNKFHSKSHLWDIQKSQLENTER